jgi:ribosomal protein S27E
MRTIETTVETGIATSGKINRAEINQIEPSPILEAIGKPALEIVRCPNCGSLAERYYSATQQRLQCDHCDYLMATCAKTGRVIEAYAPGVAFTAHATYVTLNSVVRPVQP